MDHGARVLHSLKWAAAGRLLSQLCTWAITIVVIRILTPADYGLLAMAMVVVSFLTMMADMGLGPALVQTRQVDEQQMRQVFGLSLLLNLSLAVALLLSAPLIARFFEEPRLTLIVQALALQFPLLSLAIVPQAMLDRRMGFKAKALVEFSANLAGSIVTLLLAWSGFGVWSLVLGTLVNALWRMVGLNIVSPFRHLPSFSLQRAGAVLSFGGQYTLTRVLWFFLMQIDVLIAGKMLGKELLGFYSVAMDLASLPVQKVSAVVNDVAFPAFARMQEELDKLAWHLLKGLRLLSMIAFPILWGVSSVAPEAVSVLLGSQWQQATLPLTLITLVMPLRMIGSYLPTAVQGIGRTDMVLKNTLLALLVMPVALLIGVRWGLVGLAVAWACVYPPFFFMSMYNYLPIVGIKMGQLWRAMAPSLLAGAVMYLYVALLRWLLGDALSDVWRLIFLAATGALVYVLMTLLVNRAGFNELLALRKR